MRIFQLVENLQVNRLVYPIVLLQKLGYGDNSWCSRGENSQKKGSGRWLSTFRHHCRNVELICGLHVPSWSCLSSVVRRAGQARFNVAWIPSLFGLDLQPPFCFVHDVHFGSFGDLGDHRIMQPGPAA